MKSPSPHCTLAQLLHLKENNYLGVGGTEYVAEEVDALISEKQGKKCAEMQGLSQREFWELFGG